MKRRDFLKTGALAAGGCFFVGGGVGAVAPGDATMEPLAIRQCYTEYLENPVAIEAAQPRLSWRMAVEAPHRRSIVQRAYQVLVASSAALLQQEEGDLWDSGKVRSPQSIHVRYAGKALLSRQPAFWKVRVWDQDDQVSPWSQVASWRMGLLESTDWDGAEWIALAEDTRNSPHSKRPFQTSGANRAMEEPVMREAFASPLMRNTFSVEKPIRTAIFYVCGLGYSELYLNGQKIGDHVLDPGQTTYDVEAMYVAHDVSDALNAGENAVGLWLGNGFYGQNMAFNPGLAYGKPRVLAKLFVEYDDGSVEPLATGDDWKAAPSPVVFDNVYAGESYDARRETPGWNKPDFDDADWQTAAVVDSPTDRLRPQLIPPIRATKVLPPVEIIDAGEGKWIVDLGQNIAGWLRLSVDEAPGTAIHTLSGEHLMPDRKSVNTASTGHFATGVKQELTYVCKGGPEQWAPRFTYHGFRYAEIDGLTSPPTPEAVQGVLVHSDVPRRGYFASSDALLNQMYEVSLWTIVDNLHSIAEDCPHREKCGWLGDVHCLAETSIFNFDMAQFFIKYMYDIESVFGRGGRTYKGEPATPGIPANVAPGKRLPHEARVDWGACMILLPWYLYVYYGEEDIIEHFWPDMKGFIRYAERYQNDEGIVENGFGDWCPPRWDRQTNPDAMECPPYLSSTAIFYQMLAIMEKLATLREESEYRDWCREKAASVKTAFNSVYLEEIEGEDALTYGSQTANAMALRYGLVPEDKKARVLKGLVWDINVRHGGHHACGVHGLKELFTVLCDAGLDDLAYKVLTNPEFPSHAYILAHDLTTWPERQQVLPEPGSDEPFNDRSYNHPFHSGFAKFFHECIGGIRPDESGPGFGHVTMRPAMLQRLSWVEASHQTLYGEIHSRWEHSTDGFAWAIDIPCNTTATVYIPVASPEAVQEGAQPLRDREDIQVLGTEDGFVKCQIGSGKYHFATV